MPELQKGLLEKRNKNSLRKHQQGKNIEYCTSLHAWLWKYTMWYLSVYLHISGNYTATDNLNITN